MSRRAFAGAVGTIYTAVGILGFIPGLLAAPPPDAPRIAMDTAYGYFLGLFPVNILHSLVHLGAGVWGLASARSSALSLTYARGLAILFGVLTVMGLIPGLNTVFGTVPLFGHDIWLHGLTALVAAYFATRRTEAVDIARDRERRAA